MMLVKQPEPQTADHQRPSLSGLLDGLSASSVQSRGTMDVVSLEWKSGRVSQDAQLGSPVQNLKLVQVPNYGTMVLENECSGLPMLVPMHIGFFQHGAQNHATSRTLVFGPGESRQVTDCFCVQEAQGGLLNESEQRFLMLPAGLRAAALSKRHTNGYSRLWEDIDAYTRKWGVARGGHLERFLRPNFRRLLPFRHAFEATEQQVGAAFFVAGMLTGVEVMPSPDFYRELAPILSIYCYGPSAVLAERNETQSPRHVMDLSCLMDVEDLRDRLQTSRRIQLATCVDEVCRVADQKWKAKSDEHRGDLRVSTVVADGWAGQTVHRAEQLVYLSVFWDPLHAVLP